MSALRYWIWLTTRHDLGPAGVLGVLEHFITPERAYYADPEEYDFLPLPAAAKRSLLDKGTDRAEEILADCERLGVRIMTLQDADYPGRLRQIADPPVILYIRGRSFHFDEEAAIGVVGAREATAYGTLYAERIRDGAGCGRRSGGIRYS